MVRVYDAAVALRRFRWLIRYTAYKYSIQGHYRMSMEDLEAEGYLTLVQCCHSFPEGQRRFGRYFKRAWNNRLTKIFRDSCLRNKKKDQRNEVDLDLHLDLPEIRDDFNIWEHVEGRAKKVMPWLTRDSQRLLQLLLKPSQEVIDYAWRDFCRKNKLHSQGFRAPGYDHFRVKARHVAGVLQMKPSYMQGLVREIRSVVQIQCGRQQ
jgi:hypothetical protein